MRKFLIYADEAWTQTHKISENRYHCFFGGFFATPQEFKKFEQELILLQKKFNQSKEIKWGNLSKYNVDFYNEIIKLVEIFLCDNHFSKYRQFFMDRHHQYSGAQASMLDSQFKMYYQFLKHSFGLQYIPYKNIQIIFFLDTHSSHYHKEKLKEFALDLPRILSRNDITIKIEFIDSKKSKILQVCDLLMGTAGYYGNAIYERKVNGKKQITKHQKLKRDFGKTTYNMLRNIDAKFRNTKAFNWFENTGTEGSKNNYFNHKLRIWKFIPNNSIPNSIWLNKNLGKGKTPIIKVAPL
ncbi:DUF3800 domain-containing protein [Acinetobacter guillouiae]|uniref:DUF3800 domain-containing protein n=1 Tax=Acinetobacter guillouiae TaxID=106649 RepID=UPI0030095C71